MKRIKKSIIPRPGKWVFLFAFLIPEILFSQKSQITWVNDMQSAKALALRTGKLIIIDFYADWCGPCKRMDNEFWSRPDVLNYSDSLIFLKINTDFHPDLAIKYRVKTIPHIALTDVNEDILWYETGFSSGDTRYLYVLYNAPADVSQLNKNLLPFIQDKETVSDYFNLAKSYQSVGKDQSAGRIKSTFLRLSDNYFKKVEKEKSEESREASLRLILNLAFRGAAKKALAKFDKYPDDYFGGDLSELSYFVKALCYKEVGEKDIYLSQRENISDPSLIKELENTN